MNFKSFEDIQSWKLSRILAKDVYLTFGRHSDRQITFITNQMLRSSGSIIDNIAEGFERGGNKEFLQYLWIAKASAGELRSQFYRAYDLQLISDDEFLDFKNRVEEISRVIYGLIKAIKESTITGQKYKV